MPSTPRGEKTHRLIIERASMVFEDRGFVAASMNQLVAATGLTRGAFYFHFESKEAVAVAIVRAQAERWPLLVEEIERDESEPLRRLLRLAFAAGEAVQRDPLIRAAHRLMWERAAIRKELPGTFAWWVDTMCRYLKDADARQQLPDLSSLVAPDSSVDAVTALAEYIIGRWSGVQQAALASGRDDLLDRVYTSWVLLLPWLTNTVPDRDALHAFIRELHSRSGNPIVRPSALATTAAPD